MLIECRVKREGPTTIMLEKMKYTFMPILGARKGEQTTSVCDVSSDEHLKYFLNPKRGGTFREYDQDRSLEELEAERKQQSAFLGFVIQKYRENGYIVVDQRNPKKQRFADMSGNWFEKRLDLSPWVSEMEAFTWLKGEIDMGLIEPAEPMEMPQARGPGRPKRVDENLGKITGTSP